MRHQHNVLEQEESCPALSISSRNEVHCEKTSAQNSLQGFRLLLFQLPATSNPTRQEQRAAQFFQVFSGRSVV